MTENKRDRPDDDLAQGILDADDTGLVRNEAQIVEEEIDEGLDLDDVSPEELPVDGRPEGRPTV
jgi:hypothetical protein